MLFLSSVLFYLLHLQDIYVASCGNLLTNYIVLLFIASYIMGDNDVSKQTLPYIIHTCMGAISVCMPTSYDRHSFINFLCVTGKLRNGCVSL